MIYQLIRYVGNLTDKNDLCWYFPVCDIVKIFFKFRVVIAISYCIPESAPHDGDVCHIIFGNENESLLMWMMGHFNTRKILMFYFQC